MKCVPPQMKYEVLEFKLLHVRYLIYHSGKK